MSTGAIALLVTLVTAGVFAMLGFIHASHHTINLEEYTDAIQFMVMVPLLLVCFGVAVFLLGGWDAALAPVRLNSPELLSITHPAGVKFGATLAIALSLASMVTTQAINSPHPLAPSPKSGEGEPGQFKVPLPTWERDLG